MTLKELASSSIRIIIYLTIPILIFIIIYIFQNLSNTGESLSHSILNKTITKTELQLKMFINPVENSLKIAKEQGKLELFTNFESEKLNQFFIPVLRNTKHLSSVLFANSLGEEYLLLQEDSTWLNRLTTISDSKRTVTRYRWKYSENGGKELIDQWQLSREQDNNPITKDWYKDAILHNKYEWTKPYIFDTTNNAGITASIKWNHTVQDSSMKYVVAFDVLLEAVSSFTTNLKVSKNGMAFIFSEHEEMLGLPNTIKYRDKISREADVLKPYNELNITEVTQSINKWKERNNTSEPFNIEIDGNDWWVQIHKYSVTEKRILYIAVIVPENDFLEQTNKTKKLILWSFLFVAFLIIIIISSYNEKRKNVNLLKKQKDEISEYNKELNQQNEEIRAQRDEIETQRDVVVTQKDEIEEIHHELSESIDYATRLQTAILPETHVLEKHLSEHFILFKPKDKVSGDFFWWSHTEEHTVITAADCTGHGVPGAFMSMLGISFLREIVQKEYITHTGVILRKLRKEIVKVLRQTGESGTHKDGMDMALISLNHKTNTLQFSGANNPLYIITKNELQVLNNEDLTAIKFIDNSELKVEDSELKFYEIKPDKMPIAIYDKMDKFTTHEIQLHEGDQIYMFSDGFADQFGGAKGKKFKYKPFKKLLLENANKPMTKQQEILESAFINWKAHLEQIDDVVVLGIKI